MKTIVISAVNLVEGGTLVILRDCLRFLSENIGSYRVVALVYKRDLADFPNIEYIETQWPKKRWTNRLWYEYVIMRKVSKNIGPVHLWLSLHDTTPHVYAERQVVYCHNPFPFYKWKLRECFFAPKIVLFALFSKFIYRKNIQRNSYVIVQQQWIKDAFKGMFSLSKDEIIIALPDAPQAQELLDIPVRCAAEPYTFIYAASPNSHKNFECLCEASVLLHEQGELNFKVCITINGKENAYADWLYKKWSSNNPGLHWLGFQARGDLFQLYGKSDCLVFPSKVETWGLPISEFSTMDKPMLLADLPYSRETASGSKFVSFFDPDRPELLAKQMKSLIEGDSSFLAPVPKKILEEPVATSWEAVFDILLKD